ncbi:hypothetical protein NDU88_000199 [Pleurodeles waltl]|uniref:Uncharacterized protein n=1 Tax=Pleurodeles waltl TaxID=8319 RepID=A0AAV7S7Z3_PLEWA|nr:hypothetical protein NDU88_000199 [Pleurodeles waltl]
MLAKRRAANTSASKQRNAKPFHLEVGDLVLAKDILPDSKFQMPFERHPFTITYRHGTNVNALWGSCFLQHCREEEDDASGPGSLNGGRTGLSLAHLSQVTLGGGSYGVPGLQGVSLWGPIYRFACSSARAWVMAEKRSRTEELLEALMLRMDAMDQAIASLKA